MVRLSNKFVPVDPETWSKEYDMSCNVGLGMGTKDQQLMHLQAMTQDMAMIAQSPFAQQLLDAKKIFNLEQKKAELAGFKDVTPFLNDPEGQPPPQPQKPEAIQKAEMQIQADQQQAAAQQQADQQKFAAQQQADQQKMQMQAQMDQQKQVADAHIAEQKLQQEMMLKRMEAMWQMQLERFQAQQNAQLEKYKADLAAEVQMKVAAMQPTENRPQ